MTKKRWSALLLALLMAISLLPVTSFPAQAAGTTYRLGLSGVESTDISWADLTAASGTITGLEENDTIVIASTPPSGNTLLSIVASGVKVEAASNARLDEATNALTINVSSPATSLTLQDLNAPAVTVAFKSTAPATLTVVGDVKIGALSGAGNLTITGESGASLTATSITATGALAVGVSIGNGTTISAVGGVTVPDARTYYVGVTGNSTYDATTKTAMLPWSALAYDDTTYLYSIPGLAADSTIIFVGDPPDSMYPNFLIDEDGVTLSSYDTLSTPNKQHTLNKVNLTADEDVNTLTLDKLVMNTAFSDGRLSLNATTPVTITVDGDSKLGAIDATSNLNIEGPGALSAGDDLSRPAIRIEGTGGEKGILSFSNALTVEGGGSSSKAIDASSIIFNGTGTASDGTRLTITDSNMLIGDMYNYTLTKGNSVSSDAIWYNNQSIASISGSEASLTGITPFTAKTTIWLEVPVRQGGSGGGVVAAVKDPSITLPVNGHRYKTGDTVFIETDSGTGRGLLSSGADPSVLTVKLDRPYDVVFADIPASFLDA